uniref:Uncharacterized protein n=1 Tax=Panagrolaimus sp. JU765 TaxID=591449 RepID=A0AC34Q3G6_9BILA
MPCLQFRWLHPWQFLNYICATYSKEDANSKITNYFSTLIEQETKNEPIIKINPRRSVLGAAATGDVITIDEDSDKEKDDFDNDDIIFLDDPQKDKPKENYVIDEWSDDDDEGYGAVPKRPSSEQMSAGPSKKTKSDG